MISDDPTITALGAARDAARRAVDAGRPGGLLDPRTAIDDYKAALADCPLDHEMLRAALRELATRLGKGLLLIPDDSAVGRHFEAILSRFEATEDALDADAARRRFARWEMRIADAMLAARARGNEVLA